MTLTQMGNVWGSAFSYVLAGLKADRPIVAVVASTAEAEDTVRDLATFGCRASALPELGTLESPPIEIVSERLRVLLARPMVLVGSVRAVLEPVQDPEAIRSQRLTVQVGQTMTMQALTARLVDSGYARAGAVERQGEFAVRGGLVDLFPLGADAPLRFEFAGDTVESLRPFDVETQSSRETLDAVDVVLVTGAIQDSLATEVLGSHLLAVNDPPQIEERLRRMYDDPSWWAERYARVSIETESHSRLVCFPLPVAGGVNLPVSSVQRFQGNLVNLPLELREFAGRHEKVVVYCANAAERDRLRGLMRDAEVHAPNVELTLGRLSRGFVYERTAHLANHELFNRYEIRRSVRRASGRPLESVLELEKGDFVVHRHSGIGRFLGIERIRREGVSTEAVALEYHGGSKLYVPVQDINLISKYLAACDAPPPLSSLSTQTWVQTTVEAQRGAEHLAKELLDVQAKRNLLGGFAFPPDDEMQRLFEAAFPYEETEDQIRTGQDIKSDLMAPRPMDRLMCGDVGFGKTELAMRAAFKCVTAGRQAAVLCPTTVLAQQHYQTFRERMADYPVQIDVLSRFRTRAEQREVLHRLVEGEVDIVIGTHRLIQADVVFKDLGLVIIDEEQRFGVEQKERLKRLRTTVDVLTLTATPIPRTLHLALLKLRDISVLSSAPVERLAVKTKVGLYDEGQIQDAVRFELARKGQVFFIHNRVHGIEEVARRVQRLVPEARVSYGHGQMPAEELEETMLRFVVGEVDVLVSTTIIENGIDIPNANTLIINNADMFGLSDLHQLRGRVGRYNRQAFAYLFIPIDRPMTPESARRLKAIEEFSELGAGFKIAMRDMELRGVGNILGKEQHGHIRAIGYELYLHLLDREVRRRKNQPIEEVPECSVSLRWDASIPEPYIPDMPTRVEAYRMISRARNPKELEEARAAVQDRFGKIPEPVENLVRVQQLKIAASRWKIQSLAETPQYYIARCFDRRSSKKLRERDPELVRLVDESTIYFAKTRALDRLIEFLSVL